MRRAITLGIAALLASTEIQAQQNCDKVQPTPETAVHEGDSLTKHFYDHLVNKGNMPTYIGTNWVSLAQPDSSTLDLLILTYNCLDPNGARLEFVYHGDIQFTNRGTLTFETISEYPLFIVDNRYEEKTIGPNTTNISGISNLGGDMVYIVSREGIISQVRRGNQMPVSGTIQHAQTVHTRTSRND